MRLRGDVLGLVGSLALVGGCTETPAAVPLRALERSGAVSFVCVTEDGAGRDLASCPDYDQDDDETRRMLALVTQTLRGEVAVVDLTRGEVLDAEPSIPGYSFLPVGAMPEDLVSTPGGMASFVGVGEPGREGIFVLPSICLDAPREGEQARELVSWPACRLESAPGRMVVLVDPPDAEGRQRPQCGAAYVADLGEPPGAARDVCPTNLGDETVAPGRRKLLVAMPELGQLALLDAQALVDLEPGSFDPCPVERWIALETDWPTEGAWQPVPEDLQAPGCIEPALNYGPPASALQSQPADLTVVDGVAYVADRGAPVVHRLTVTDPCAPVAQPPLLPLSQAERGRVVTTSHVAVSPLTTQGERFAYAVDAFQGSVMIFDVSPGSAQRTPVLRAGSSLMPQGFEAPDRLAFASPAKDVAFVLRDEPEPDPVTGVALIGQHCDPDPMSTDPVATAYRTSDNYRSGARPRQLRGVFGFVMLANGEVVVVDVEDFDAPCRRPVVANSTLFEDYRGCVGDPPVSGGRYEDAAGDRTVSGELSCRVVDPHRARSGSLLVNSADTGVSAPALRSLPLLQGPEGGNLPADDSEDGRLTPKLLAVEFPDPADPEVSTPLDVYVGTTRYSSAEAADAQLALDPRVAARNSVAMVLSQPRAFAYQDAMSVTYEGSVVGERPAGLLRLTGTGDPDLLEDADGRFCDRGVQDATLTREVGEGFGLAGAELEDFVARHTDYVQITAEFPDEDDSYWTREASVGYTCGGQTPGTGFSVCESLFGTPEEPSLLRDLAVLEAYQQRLVVVPRQQSRDDLLDLIYCCFGAGEVLSYRVRAGHQWVVRGEVTGLAHDIVAGGADWRCVRDCSPRSRWARGRAFEVATTDQVCDEDGCEQQACVFPPATVAAEGSEAADYLPPAIAHDSPCVFQNLNYRFAVYRGREASERGMSFTWEQNGGFVPLSTPLVTAGGGGSVLPESMVYVPELGSLAVTDGAQKGLIFISLEGFGVSHLYN